MLRRVSRTRSGRTGFLLVLLSVLLLAVTGVVYLAQPAGAQITSLVIRKQVLAPGPYSTSFRFDCGWDCWPGDDWFSLAPQAGIMLTQGVEPGTDLYVTETVPAGWRLDSIVCTPASGINSYEWVPGTDMLRINLKWDADAVCTFTDSQPDKGRIIVTKDTDPETTGPAFRFDASWSETDFFLADGESEDSGWTLDPMGGAGASDGYSVSEVNLPVGWVLDSVQCQNYSGVVHQPGDIDLEAGETVVCLFKNVPTSGRSLTIEKVAWPADNTPFTFSGSWAFTLSDPGSSSVTFQDLGDFTWLVTEEATPGWQLFDIYCEGDMISEEVTGSTLHIRIPEDGAAKCTFGNLPAGALLAVRKETDPQTGVNSPSFPFTATGLTPAAFNLADEKEEWFVGLAAGTYGVAEGTPPAGWIFESVSCVDFYTEEAVSDGDLGAAVSVTLAEDQRVHCTFLNRQLPAGSLTVVKDADPADDSEFDFTVARNGGEAELLILQDPSDPLETFAVPGVYTVTEAAPPTGWVFDDVTCTGAAVSSHDGPTLSVTVGAEETVVCTFENSGWGYVLVEKLTDPANDPTAWFDFSSADLAAVSVTVPDLRGGQNSGSLMVPAGVYRVSEDAEPGWDLTGLVCTDQQDASGASTVDLAGRTATFNVQPGEYVRCTFTNTERGEIVVRKGIGPADAVGYQPAGGFDFSGGLGTFSLLGGEQQVFGNLAAYAQYRVEEAAPPAPWVLENASCTGSDSRHETSFDPDDPAGFLLYPGETITCTFENLRLPEGSLLVIKDASPGDGTPFSFGTSGVEADGSAVDLGAFVLNDPGAPSKLFEDLETGVYAITEGAVPGGWQFDGVSCVSDGEPVAAVIDGQSVTVPVSRYGPGVACTFRNSGHGRIIVNKGVSPTDAPAATFGFDASFGSFSLAGGEMHDSGLIPAGVYSVAELAPLPEGWSLASASCSDGSAPSAIGVSPGETVTCTFNNRYQPPEQPPTGSLTVVKMTSPAGGAGFGFDGTLGAFTLGHGGSQLFDGLAAGGYAVTETGAAGWEFEDVACSTVPGAAVDYEVVGSGVVVNLAEGQDVTCVFSNREEGTVGPEGSLTIIKQTVPAGGTGFAFDAGTLGTFSLDDGSSETFTELAGGPYTVTETPASGWEFASVTCDALDYTTDGASVTVNLTDGEAAVCTFTNGGLPYTGAQPSTLPLLVTGLAALLMGLALAVWSLMREADKA